MTMLAHNATLAAPFGASLAAALLILLSRL
jgi:hypothetical protein